MSAIARCGVASRRARVDINRPSRKTVTLSAISNTSSMRWLTKRMATPCLFRSRTSLNSSWTSWAESDAVGSSMMRMRTLREIALAISTDCWAANVSPRAGFRTSSATPSSARILSASLKHLPPADHRSTVLMTDENVLGDIEIGKQQRLLIDRGDAQSLRLGGAAYRQPAGQPEESRRDPADARRL